LSFKIYEKNDSRFLVRVSFPELKRVPGWRFSDILLVCPVFNNVNILPKHYNKKIIGHYYNLLG
jgi:hypothetical protein